VTVQRRSRQYCGRSDDSLCILIHVHALDTVSSRRNRLHIHVHGLDTCRHAEIGSIFMFTVLTRCRHAEIGSVFALNRCVLKYVSFVIFDALQNKCCKTTLAAYKLSVSVSISLYWHEVTSRDRWWRKYDTIIKNLLKLFHCPESCAGCSIVTRWASHAGDIGKMRSQTTK
jgi:hypothetical protein